MKETPTTPGRRAGRAVLALTVGGISALGMAQTDKQLRAEEIDDILGEVVERLAQPAGGPSWLPDALTDDDFRTFEQAQVDLGGLLFYDKILSGNENISCATCHHGLADMGDGLSLPIGEGAAGLGVTRNTGTGTAAVHERVPRNAPHTFNLGALEFDTMFHDGRVQVDPNQPSGFLSPAGNDLPLGLGDVIAVQAMFPVTSGTEMAGQPGENLIANAADAGNLAGPGGVWERLAGRLQGIPEYVTMFMNAFDDIGGPGDITYAHAARAIGAWESTTFRADNSPFDRFLRGERQAMSQSAKKGMRLFYGAAKCSTCHSGPLQTNHEFRSIAMPQIGPGKGDNQDGYSDGHDDFGRERVTGNPSDRFRFRVPSLRNVALTAPYGHSGAYDTLEAVVRHHLDPVSGVATYDAGQAVLPSRPDLDALDFVVQNDGARLAAIAASNEAPPRSLSDKQMTQLMDFLHALTDPTSVDIRRTVPKSVPSGLPVFD